MLALCFSFVSAGSSCSSEAAVVVESVVERQERESKEEVDNFQKFLKEDQTILFGYL